MRRAGDVIPEITIPIIENDLKRSNKFIPPTNCPSCKEELVTENVFLVCPNKYSCPDQVSGSLFISALKMLLILKDWVMRLFYCSLKKI